MRPLRDRKKRNTRELRYVEALRFEFCQRSGTLVLNIEEEIMNIETEKENIKRKIDLLDDVGLLETINDLLTTPPTEGSQQNLSPMTVEEYRAMIAESEEDVRQGRIYSHDEVVKYLRD